MPLRHLPAVALAAALAIAAPALAQHGESTASLQGGDNSAWRDSPHMHAFYELTRQSFANGPARVDFPTYQEKSFEIFGKFGVSLGWGAEAMVDHLKAIPGQMLQIVAEDPKVLESYEAFHTALAGPP